MKLQRSSGESARIALEYVDGSTSAFAYSCVIAADRRFPLCGEVETHMRNRVQKSVIANGCPLRIMRKHCFGTLDPVILFWTYRKLVAKPHAKSLQGYSMCLHLEVKLMGITP